MSKIHDASALAPAGFEHRPRAVSSRAARLTFFLLYALALFGPTVHIYRHPIYDMDSIQYMGNALLMEERDVVKIHDRVYAEIGRFVPQNVREQLLGRSSDAPADQYASRQMRARDPYRYAEFLPLFAIRPLYNQILWLVSKFSGLGLVRSGVLISTASYFLTGLLLFAWVRRHASGLFSLVICLLLMLSPPLTVLGRDTTSDALATLVAFFALYLIFEKRRLALGSGVLLASIYFRTDFVVLAGPVFLACWWMKRLDLWKAALLSSLALGSVLTINHFGGDYGIKMLYYRNFIAVPLAPAEIAVQFSFRDYLTAFRSGVTLVFESFFLPFLLLGVISLTSERARILFAVTLAYVILHFLVLPNWQERWVGVFYLSMTVCAVLSLRSAVSD